MPDTPPLRPDTGRYDARAQRVFEALDAADRQHTLGPGPLVVAFSGGPDSLALLVAARARHAGTVVAAHLDHGLDPASAQRAEHARLAARALGTSWFASRAEPIRRTSGFQGVEAWARQRRYAFLEQARRHHGSAWVLTAHHLDDQAETVLLRMRSGSGIWGLRGVRSRHGRVLRPLLGLRRVDLIRFLSWARERPELGEIADQAVDDPTNRDLKHQRNLIRRVVLPRLETASARPESTSPEVPGQLSLRLARLARRAEGLHSRALPQLQHQLSVRRVSNDPNSWQLELATTFDQGELRQEHLQLALQALHRSAAAPPVRRSVVQELLRQADGGAKRVRVAAGGGWLWEIGGARQRLLLRAPRNSRQPATPQFAYTFTIPGSLWLPEISRTIRVFRSQQTTATPLGAGALTLLLPPTGRRLVVRTRRPGDRRFDPIGSSQKKLKKVLARLPITPAERDAIPLLALEEGPVVATLGLGERVAPRSLSRVPSSVGHALELWNVLLND